MTETEALAVVLRHVSLGKSSDVDAETYAEAFTIVGGLAKQPLASREDSLPMRKDAE